MGKFHAQAIAERKDVEFVAVCDVDPARAAAVAGSSGARVETDVRRIAGQVDAAVIAAATGVHREVALALMEKGTAVLIEKPTAATAAEARLIADAARRAGVVAQAGHILRFDPVTRAVAGRASKPTYMEISWAAPFAFRSLDVGVVMDVLIHGIDIALYLAGEMPQRVDAVGGVVVGPHEDFVSVRLAFPGGCIANLTASRMSRARQRIVRIFSEGCYLKLDYGARAAEVVTPKPGLAEVVRAGKPPAGGMDDLITVEKLPVESQPDALRAQLASFIEAVRGEHPVAVTLDDGARAVEVAERIIKSIGPRP
jgi:predicted dehydrogenase